VSQHAGVDFDDQPALLLRVDDGVRCRQAADHVVPDASSSVAW
jgi:hypothetical protein